MPLICSRLRDPATKALYYSIHLTHFGRAGQGWQDRFTANPKLGGYVRELLAVRESRKATVSDYARRLIQNCTALRRLVCAAAIIPVQDNLNNLETLLVFLAAEEPEIAGIKRLFNRSLHVPSLGIYAEGDAWTSPPMDPTFSSKGRLTTDRILMSGWDQVWQGGLCVDSFLSALAVPPTTVAMIACILPDVHTWQRVLSSLAWDLKNLALHISDNIGTPQEIRRDRTMIHGFKFSDLSGFKELQSLSLIFVSIKEDEFQIPESVKHLKLTWHLSAWPFWESISQGLQGLKELPALEIVAVDNWRHVPGEDFDEDTLESLVRDFGAITAISVIYGLEGQSITPSNLTDFWLQHQEKALPEYLFNRLVATCQNMVDSLTEEPDSEE